MLVLQESAVFTWLNKRQRWGKTLKCHINSLTIVASWCRQKTAVLNIYPASSSTKADILGGPYFEIDKVDKLWLPAAGLGGRYYEIMTHTISKVGGAINIICLLYTSPSPRDS